jgi:hypothetical protein
MLAGLTQLIRSLALMTLIKNLGVTMKQDFRGGDGSASRRSNAPSVTRVVGGVCGGANNLVPRVVAPTSSI